MTKAIDLEKYDPRKLAAEQLINDWKVITNWYSSKELSEEPEIPYEFPELITLAKRIYPEMIQRISEGHLEYSFKPEKMIDTTRKMFELVKSDIFNPLYSDIESENLAFTHTLSKVESVMDSLQDFAMKCFKEEQNKIIRFAVEKKPSGKRLLLSKEGDAVGITGEDLEFNPEIQSQAKLLSREDFVIEGILDKDRFYVSDILYLNKPLTDLPWFERKRKLNELTFTNNILKTFSLIADNRDEFLDLIDIAKKVPDSNGVIIRSYDGAYGDGFMEIGKDGDKETNNRTD